MTGVSKAVRCFLSGRITNFWLDFFMRKHTVSFYLLLVLIPLLNLGPSLHRHSCFGLHGNSCCSIVDDVGSHCCCDHHSSCSDTSNGQNAPQLKSDSSHSDCPFCRFFTNFNVVQAPVDLITIGFRCCEVTLHIPDVCVCEIIPDHARGPPLLSIVAA